ncbi:MAG: PTS sugar transporter subunit IIB [Anaerolineae bacterium]|nr:PTS sugar transporter subunit IIB [Anaerolineae bacterium]MDH7472619.1 PTS sugar transporter subunit IIB [Anaerolineae bacterium]
MRIDDRLIHGQVIANWIKVLRSDRIVIVDDSLATDPFMQGVMRLAAPPGITVEVCTVQEGLVTLGKSFSQGDKALVLVRSPQVAERLYQGGVKFKTLNVGGIGAAPGRRSVFKNISMSDEEIAILKHFLVEGVEVILQTVPDERGVAFASLADKL